MKRSSKQMSRAGIQSATVIPLDPAKSARAAGLRYVCDQSTPGIRRLGRPKRFQYRDASGRKISDKATLQRIYALAIPPAWKDVWICPQPDGHLQATGRDIRGRKQYRYHARWRVVRDDVKYGRLVAFAAALPRIRARTETDLARSGLPREKVVAAVVQLLERTLIRIGNDEYARQNGSIGLTTMRDGHAKVNGSSAAARGGSASGRCRAFARCRAWRRADRCPRVRRRRRSRGIPAPSRRDHRVGR
jgi:DNA topoisomerase-1